MDIATQILEDHARQRRMFAALDEIDRDDAESLGPVWQRLRTFLEVHAAAEEEIFYPRLLQVGAGATDADSSEEETEDAISDHNEIRDAIAKAEQRSVGTDAWWEAVAETRKANSEHMAEEERQALADFRAHTDPETRHELAVKFVDYEAEHVGGVEAEDQEPQRYIAEHS